MQHRQTHSFFKRQKVQETSCVPHQLARVFLVSGQSSQGASTRQTPLTILPHLLGTFRADVCTLT